MHLHRQFWIPLICACLFSPESLAFFALERPSSAMLEVADVTDFTESSESSEPTATAPVERLRIIPEDAGKGVMWPPEGRRVRINDSIKTLAPGATIRDMNNRMVLPGSVRQPQKIRYTLDVYGQVRRIWISSTGEYMGRHQPMLPPDPRNE